MTSPIQRSSFTNHAACEAAPLETGRRPVPPRRSPEPPAEALSTDESILRRLFRRGDEPARLARSCGLSLVDLARWASRVDHVELLVGLERVSDACFRAALARSRVVAARTLTRLASGDGDEALTDLTRRSCVDLLSACAERRREARSAASTGVDRARRAAPDRNAASLAPPVPGEEAILAALERAAREGDADDDGRDSGTSSPAATEQSDAA